MSGMHAAGVAQCSPTWSEIDRRLQRKVLKAVDRLQRNHILRDMRRAAKKNRLKGQNRDPRTSHVAPPVLAMVERHVLRRLDKLLKRQDSLRQLRRSLRPPRHAYRCQAAPIHYGNIAVRRVPGDWMAPVEVMKKLQTLLGDIHDCDVWMDVLDAFARKLRRRMVRSLRPRRPLLPLRGGHPVPARRSIVSSPKDLCGTGGLLVRIGQMPLLGTIEEFRRRNHFQEN